MSSFTGMAAVFSNSLAGYDLTTAIGPISGIGGMGFNENCAPGPDPCIGTSRGLLSFTSNIEDEGTVSAVLQPVPVPEPATLLLTGGGLATAFVRRRRRGRRS